MVKISQRFTYVTLFRDRGIGVLLMRIKKYHREALFLLDSTKMTGIDT